MSPMNKATPTHTASRLWLASVQIAILAALCIWAFWPEMRLMVTFAQKDIEAAHSLAAPVLIFLLFLRRRRLLAQSLDRGSPLGVALLVAALAVLAVWYWPFDFHLARSVAIVPALAGCILLVAGWRFLWHCLPMLSLLLIAIPIGPRFYSRLIIAPERITLDAVQATLNLLPNVTVELVGRDLQYLHPDHSLMIATGEYHHAATLLFAYLSIVIFVVFTQTRSFWQVLLLIIVACPFVLICNYVRLMSWSLTMIYGQATETSPWPRIVAVVVSLLLAYSMAGLSCGVVANLVSDRSNESEDMK